jgi:hypothetical protein
VPPPPGTAEKVPCPLPTSAGPITAYAPVKSFVVKSPWPVTWKVSVVG